MSLSNMWASGRKEMRQSSSLGHMTFCRGAGGNISRVRQMQVTGGTVVKTHVGNFEEAGEICNHVAVAEHDSLWVSCIRQTTHMVNTPEAVSVQPPELKDTPGSAEFIHAGV